MSAETFRRTSEERPTLLERAAVRRGYAALADSASPNSNIVETVVAGLADACLLQSPETAAEHERLKFALKDACEQIAGLESDLGGATARVAELEAAEQRVQHALAPRWDLAPDAQAVVSTALSDSDHVHEYQHFGPYAGSRCVTCNHPQAAEATDPAPYGPDRCMHGTSINVECGGCDALGQIGGEA